MRDTKRSKEVNELRAFFHLSLLQVKLDNESIESNESILKLITLDKVLKLYFDSYVCCFYKDKPEILLTKDEIQYLNDKNDSSLVFIRQSLLQKCNVLKVKNNIEIYFKTVKEWNKQERMLLKFTKQVF